MRYATVVFIFFLGQFLSAQELRISVLDDETSVPLIGANIKALYEADTIAVTTDLDGILVIKSAAGLKRLIISYLGYNTYEQEADFGGANELEVRLIINESNIAVNPIIIANPFLSNDVSFNRKEFQVLPGAYEDPSRLLLKAPGFTTSNDQANSILYKGMPSVFINWMVNDALVVNPNHLSNAGTLSDVSSANAGGVNMISGQVIGKYDFQSAPYNLPGNNAIAGNSNIEFSDYNNTYLNLSLVGLEAGYGFNGKKLPGAQFNYRYSTVGILTGVLGLDFGGEEIVYQDLFSKFDLIDNENEKFSAFVVLGRSSNNKKRVADPELVESYRDVQDIGFSSDLMASGLSYNRKMGSNSLKAALNFSAKEDSRNSTESIFLKNSNIYVKQQIASGTVEIKHRKLSFGLNTHYITDWKYVNNGFGGVGSGEAFEMENFNLMPYLNYEKEGSWYYFSGGTGLSFNSATNHVNLEPQLKFIGKSNRSLEVEFAYRRNTQILHASSFTYQFEPNEIVGNHFDFYLRLKKKKYTAYVNTFFHSMSGILTENNSYYSQYNGVDNPLIGEYNYNGKASSTGFSVGISGRDLFLKNLSTTVNATVFNSNFNNSINSEVTSNTFDFGSSYNVLASYVKPMKRSKEMIISFSVHTRGGLHEYAIDRARSNERVEVVYDFTGPPALKLEQYTRMDFRFVYNLRKSKDRRFAKSISLDIQNIANRENDAFYNQDFLTGEQFVQKQLGLIPILAYRIEF